MGQWQKSVPSIPPGGAWLIVHDLGDSGQPKGPTRCVFAESAQDFVAERQVFWSELVAIPEAPTPANAPVSDAGPTEAPAAAQSGMAAAVAESVAAGTVEAPVLEDEEPAAAGHDPDEE